MGSIVFIGVKFVNKFAGVALACVLLTIVSIYVGIAVNVNGNHKAEYVFIFCSYGGNSPECNKFRDIFRLFLSNLIFRQRFLGKVSRSSHPANSEFQFPSRLFVPEIEKVRADRRNSPQKLELFASLESG